MTSNFRETILLRLPNWVGDVLMATPVLRALRENFPESKIVVLGKPWSRDLLDGHPAVDEIITAPFQSGKLNVRSIMALVKQIKEQDPQWGLLLPNSLGSALIFVVAGIPNRVGYSTNGRSIVLNRGVPVPHEKMHQIDSFLHLLTGFSLDGPWDKTLYFPIQDQKMLEAEALWKEWNVIRTDVIVGLNPGAAWGPSKRWLPANFAAAGEMFQRELGARILIFGGPEDVPLAQEIASRMQTPPLIAAGRDNLRVLPALLSRCNLLITNDTGPMHIAASQKVPQVVLFGPTDPRQTSYSDPSMHVIRKDLECSPCFEPHCPLGHHRCMSEISPAEVFFAGSTILDRRT